MTHKFRASYTILDMWSSGNWEMAIKQYFKLEKFITPAMADGQRWHEKWRDHVIKTKTMPIEFGGKPLVNPVVEEKRVVEVAEWLDLVGIIDCLDGSTIYDWKTGKTTSESYAGSKQIGIYGIIANLKGIYVDKGEIHHYDQYTKKADMSIVWITPELLDDTYNWLITISSEMHSYFEKNELYEKFGAVSLPQVTEVITEYA